MTVIPIQTSRVAPFPKETIVHWIEQSLQKKATLLKDGDIFVMSSKIVSYFEGNIVKLSEMKVSEKADEIGRRMNSSSALIQLAIDQSDKVIAETPWVLLTKKHGIFTSNAGVDVSNVPKGYAITWPKDPFGSARNIRKALMKKFQVKKLAVLIIDSFCIPGRKGTIAGAIGISGMQGYQDLKGQKDLYENILRYSALNRVDSLATAANLIMGESTELTPLAIIRGYAYRQIEKIKKGEMVISPSDEMYPL